MNEFSCDAFAFFSQREVEKNQEKKEGRERDQE